MEDAKLKSHIFLSKDDVPFVCKEALSQQERRKLENLRAEDVAESYAEVLAQPQTDLVQAVTPSYGIVPDCLGYENELPVVPELPKAPDGYVSVFFPCCVADDLVPLDMKKLGVKIKRRIQNCYVEYSPEKDEVIFFDKHGKEIKEPILNGEAEIEGLDLTVVTPRFLFCEKDYKRIQNIDSKLDKAETSEAYRSIINGLNDEDFELYDFYDRQRIMSESFYFVLMHEFKHIKNELLLQNRLFKKDYAVPSTADLYLLEVEDERTAYLESLFCAVETYLKKGDLRDFSTFFAPDFDWLIDKLDNLSEEEIISFFYPPQKVMNLGLKMWNEAYFSSYNEQFKDNLMLSINSLPFLPTDEDRREFNRELRLLYTFRVYNPNTKKQTIFNLADAVEEEVPQNLKIKKNLIIPAQRERVKRFDRIERIMEKNAISKKLFDVAKELVHRRYKESIEYQVMRKYERAGKCAHNVSLFKRARDNFFHF